MSGAPKPLDVVLTRHAERDLLSLPDEVRQRIKTDILRLASGQIPFSQLKKLTGCSPAVRQLTSGAFRVLYRRASEQSLLLRVVSKPQQVRALRALR